MRHRTDFRGFRCLFSRLSAVGNMRSAQQAALLLAGFQAVHNVGRRKTDQLVRIFLDRRLDQLLDS